MRLAQMAHDAALAVSGVVRTDVGPAGLFVSVGDGRRVEGVICAADRDGGYAISLRLVCALMPLQPIAEQVRAAVTAAGSAAAIRVVSVNVAVADVAGPAVG
jgi:hypothetical protein